MRTVIYARFSSEHQNPLSTVDQVRLCRERVTREGWTVVGVHTDDAISGAAGIGPAQRPGLNALLAQVEAGGIDQVMAESTDRIARHVADAHLVRERIEFCGARLFTLLDGQVTPIIGLVKGFMDAQFRSDLKARVRRGQQGNIARGRTAGGMSYGYRIKLAYDAKGERIPGLREIDNDQAAIVRRIFAEFAAGQSARSICIRLTADNISPPKRGLWRANSLMGTARMGTGLLRNRLYIGMLVYGRTQGVVDPRSRRIRWRRGDDIVDHLAPELRIVDDTLWAAVQSRLADAEGKRPEQMRRPKHLLSGLGVCGRCGAAWVKMSSRNWGCARHFASKGCDNGRTLATRQFERRVLGDLKRHMLAPDLVTAYVREYHREYARQSADTGRERAKTERRHAEAERKLQRLVGVIADGGGEFAELRQALAAAKADRDAAARALAGLDAMPVLALHPGLADEYRRQVEALEEELSCPEATMEARPRLRAMIARIVVTPLDAPRGVTIEVVRHLDEVLALSTRNTLIAAR